MGHAGVFQFFSSGPGDGVGNKVPKYFECPEASNTVPQRAWMILEGHQTGGSPAAISFSFFFNIISIFLYKF